jgi:lipopolysaccharide transport system permease protein
MLRDLKASRSLAWRLFERDLKARYRQSLLGPLWVFIPSLAPVVIFTTLNETGAINVGYTHLPYPLFVLLGTIMWQLFADSLRLPLKAVKSGRSLLKTVKLPVEALVLSQLGDVIFNFSIRTIILIIGLILFKISFTIIAIFSLVCAFFVAALGLGIGLLLVPLGSLYSDVTSALPFIINFGFFLTPVIYSPPQQFPYSVLVNLNPVSPLLTGARDLISKGFLSQPVPFVIASMVSILLLVIGWIFYRISVPTIIERS